MSLVHRQSKARQSGMEVWCHASLVDDMRPIMEQLASRGRAFALATIAYSEGGPRPTGSQMVITEDEHWGYLAGGCVEEDVAIHAREVLRTGEPSRLVYGRGSPFIDMRLPCGRRIELLVERITPDDQALDALLSYTKARQPVWWGSDGFARRCALEQLDHDYHVQQRFTPAHRMIVIGQDPFASGMVQLASKLNWEVILVSPSGPEHSPCGVTTYSRSPAPEALALLGLDRWTAVALATHDVEQDHSCLSIALKSEAAFVGVLGSRLHLPDRLSRLRAAGLTDTQISRLSAPIGLAIGAASPWEVAVSTIAQVIAAFRRGEPQPSPATTTREIDELQRRSRQLLPS